MMSEIEVRKWRDKEIERLSAMVDEDDIQRQMDKIYILTGVLND